MYTKEGSKNARLKRTPRMMLQCMKLSSFKNELISTEIKHRESNRSPAWKANLGGIVHPGLILSTVNQAFAVTWIFAEHGVPRVSCDVFSPSIRGRLKPRHKTPHVVLRGRLHSQRETSRITIELLFFRDLAIQGCQ